LQPEIKGVLEMFSEKVTENLKRSSWIRAMFEEGERLRRIHGNDKVYDFTLGNPDPEPPVEVINSIKNNASLPNVHKYMSNAGYPDVREKVAAHVSRGTGLELNMNHVVMTVGAAGGLNVVMKSILNPDDEVIALAPFFAEYTFYIDNSGGRMVKVNTDSETFMPIPAAIEKAITAKTKAIIINSPNNPSGAVYSEEILKEVAAVLLKKGKELGTTIYVISDEPYTKLVYDGAEVPSMLNIFQNSIVVSSFSKSLALPGERIGYIIVNPAIKDVELLISALAFCTRTLGFVNAPSLLQKVVAENLEVVSDIQSYKERRDALYNILINAGFTCEKPKGAFYLFPKCPIEDDGAFVKAALKYNLIVVGGTGFAFPGYFRLAYCVSMDTIMKSEPAFRELAKEFGLR
jgi:aspartate aminotransferase